MGKETAIQWTDHTANFWSGCVEVSPGCGNCYARELTKVFHPEQSYWGVHAPRLIHAGTEKNVMAWQRAAEKAGVRKRVFCQSMSDIGESVHHNHPQRRQLEDLQNHIFLNIIPATPNLDWLLLTKRVGNMQRIAPYDWLHGDWPFNAWMGISVVNQEEADRDIPKLLALPARVQFLSCEPMLGEIDLTRIDTHTLSTSNHICYRDALTGELNYGLHSTSHGWQETLHWVICGGESRTNARPMHPDWARSLRDQCNAAGVPFFFKQWGEWVAGGNTVGATMNYIHRNGWTYGTGLHIQGNADPFPAVVSKVGKKAAGRLLDGRTWDEFPKGGTS